MKEVESLAGKQDRLEPTCTVFSEDTNIKTLILLIRLTEYSISV